MGRLPGSKNKPKDIPNDNILNENIQKSAQDINFYSNTSNAGEGIDMWSDDGSKDLLIDRGVTGLTRFGGFVYEEFDPRLQGRKGMNTYREMRDNDATIGAIMNIYENLLKQLIWPIKQAGETEQDKLAKQFLESCFEDMSFTWTDTLSEILTFLPFGFCIMEECYKMRNKKDSKYPDSKIGWKYFGIRAQETMWRWNWDEEGNIIAMEQIAPPDFKLRRIPLRKALHFRTRCNKNNPEGRSFLRNSYRSWYFKKGMEEFEAIGIERDIGGIPEIRLPQEIINQKTDQARQTYNTYKKIGTNIKMNQQTCLILPSERDETGNYKVEFNLLENKSKRLYDVSKVITRYDNAICRSVLTQFLMLGENTGGSYSLSKNHTDIFRLSLNSIADIICDVFNRQAIPRLFELNVFEGLTDLPQLSHEGLEEVDLTELGNFVKNTFSAGLLTADEDLENYLRETAGMPVRQDYKKTPDIKVKDGEKNNIEQKIGREINNNDMGTGKRDDTYN